MRILALAASIVIVTSCIAFSETWVVESLDPQYDTELAYREIVFRFENGVLILNTDYIATWPGSSQRRYDLLFSGNWASAGGIDAVGNLLPDPYATFIFDGNAGHISWASNTPHGYTVAVMVGASFNGNGAATYQDYTMYEPTGQAPIQGTLVLWQHLSMRPLEYDRYQAVQHTFTATYESVPEPSSLAALGLVMAVTVTALMKGRRS